MTRAQERIRKAAAALGWSAVPQWQLDEEGDPFTDGYWAVYLDAPPDVQPPLWTQVIYARNVTQALAVLENLGHAPTPEARRCPSCGEMFDARPESPVVHCFPCWMNAEFPKE